MDLNESHKTMLQMVMKELVIPEKVEVYKKGGKGEICFLVMSGEVEIKEGPAETVGKVLGCGSIVGDFPSLLKNEDLQTTVSTLSKVNGYLIEKEDLVSLLNRAPGLLLYFKDNFFVE